MFVESERLAMSHQRVDLLHVHSNIFYLIQLFHIYIPYHISSHIVESVKHYHMA